MSLDVIYIYFFARLFRAKKIQKCQHSQLYKLWKCDFMTAAGNGSSRLWLINKYTCCLCILQPQLVRCSAEAASRRLLKPHQFFAHSRWLKPGMKDSLPPSAALHKESRVPHRRTMRVSKRLLGRCGCWLPWREGGSGFLQAWFFFFQLAQFCSF